MKTLNPLSLFCGSLCLTGSLMAQDHRPQGEIEIPINKVFAPTMGYDDNDPIQLVIDGNLPNACYSVSETVVEKDLENRVIWVRQYAERSTEGVCADFANLPEEMKVQIPFSPEVSFGKIPQGQYTIRYLTGSGVQERPLHVDVAPASTVDSLRYPILTNAFAAEYVSIKDSTFEIRLSGQVTSSCAKIKPFVKTVVQDDVIIVLPELEYTEDVCLPSAKPFYKVFNIAVPQKAGRYLLHARSLGGHAKNKLFYVTND